LDKAEIFDLGLRYYQVGDYTKAVRAFEHFLEFFHSREVYHNLAASHHQLALRYYHQAQPETLPFKLTLGVDPTTRARGVTLRGLPAERLGPAAFFHEHINKAIEFYKTAISLDSEYALSLNNLGCALIAQGPEEAFEAIATLQKAHKMRPNAPDILNNLGVAFYLANLPQQARLHLQQARERDGRYAAPLLNLGKIARGAQRDAEARRYWRDYLRLDAASSWAVLLRRQEVRLPAPAGRARTAGRQAEDVMGVTVAAFEDEIPRGWGPPRMRHRILLEEEPLTVTRYPQGITTFSQEEEIVMILALEEYGGKSAMGIAIGSSEKAVLHQYRNPSRTLDMTQGESWVYDEYGISFQIRNGKVVSWLLF
jgi:tetratricopeptide (TPR) repeat protein